MLAKASASSQFSLNVITASLASQPPSFLVLPIKIVGASLLAIAVGQASKCRQTRRLREQTLLLQRSVVAHQAVQYAEAQARFGGGHLRDAEDFERCQHQHQATGQDALAMRLQAGEFQLLNVVHLQQQQ